MKSATQTTLALLSSLIFSASAQAALHDRGYGLLYDDVLNVTWLQDANYAKTSGFDADGLMDWTQADDWAQNLHYLAANGQDYSGFRLAANTARAGGTNFTNADAGYSNASPLNELAYMYYVNLGLKSMLSATGVGQSNYGVHGLGASNGQADVGLVKNLQSGLYWSGTSYGSGIDGLGTIAWTFNTAIGYQSALTIEALPGFPAGYELSAWVVHDGDIVGPPPVPEPSSMALMLAGLAGVAVVVKRRRLR